MTNTHRSARARLRGSSGQSMLEFALLLPLFLVMVLGVVEFGFALLDHHVVTKLSREGSNLISRDATLQQAELAMRSMSTRPVNFSNGTSKMIFSVLRKGDTVGNANYNKIYLYQRHTVGTYAGTSKLITRGSASFNGAPNYEATGNHENNSNLQVTNVPANLITSLGGMIYVTEIYSRHDLITPLGSMGQYLSVLVPTSQYSIAYF